MKTTLTLALTATVVATTACPDFGGGRMSASIDSDDPAPDGPVVVDPACTANGCLQEVVHIGDYDQASVEFYLQPGVVIDNGYTVLTVRYATDGRSSTAAVTLPLDANLPEAGFPVVVNAHGTIGVDDPCQMSNTVSGVGLAGLFGARGAVSIAPDYPGLGTDGLHAYLDTREEGTSVLDAARAAHNVARLRSVRTSAATAIVGLSQGGHAVFAAASLHSSYAPDLDIRAFGVTAPASMYEEQWLPMLNFEGPHLSFAAMLAWTWAELAGADQQLKDQMWSATFAPQVSALMTERCLWSPRFGGEPTLVDAISTVPSEVFSAPFISAWTSGQWGAWEFLGAGFDANRVEPFEQTAPIKIWQGSSDTVVLPADTHALVNDLNAGGMDIEIVDVAGGTHVDTAFGFLAANERATAESVAWVQGLLLP